MDSPQIVVVGSFVQDLTFQCAEFPRSGETVIGQFSTGPGGKGSNQAVAAARAGGTVGFIGAVGRDAFGAGARSFQEAEGVGWLGAEKTDRPTGAAGILVDARGQNEIIVSLDANNALTRADVDAHAAGLRMAKVVVTQLEANLDAEAHAMQIARGAGATVILNPAPMRPDFDAALLKNVDILIPNETEFAALIGLLPQTRDGAGEGFDERKLETMVDGDLHALCRLLGVATVIVTLGARGCFVSRQEGHALIPAVRGIVAVDTTGAGDAFVGAFAAALAEFGTGEIERGGTFCQRGRGVVGHAGGHRSGDAPGVERSRRCWQGKFDELSADYADFRRFRNWDWKSCFPLRNLRTCFVTRRPGAKRS